MDRVIEFLEDSIKTRMERNNTYKESTYEGAYIQHGYVMNALFPNGINLQTPSDINRYSCISAMVSKLIREVNNFEKGGHEDSMRDMPVYAAMLRELDEDAKDDAITRKNQ